MSGGAATAGRPLIEGPNAGLKWAVVGCGAILLLGAVIGSLVSMTVVGATAGPEEAVQEFLAAAGEGDYAAAHEYFSAPLKEVQGLDDFSAIAGTNPGLFRVTDTTFSERSVDLAGARLAGTVTLESGTQMPASFDLVKENGEWRLIAYQIGS